MKDNIINLDLHTKKTTEPSIATNEENDPVCVRLVTTQGNEERLILPSGVHDVDQIHNYREIVFEVVGNSLDSINIVVE